MPGGGRIRGSGAESDHLRGQLADLYLTLDKTMHCFYFGSKPVTKSTVQKLRGYQDRFLSKTIGSLVLGNFIRLHNEHLKAVHAELRKGAGTSDPRKVRLHYINVANLRKVARESKNAIVDHVRTTLPDYLAVEKAEDFNKRIEKVVEWMLGHSDLITQKHLIR